MCNKQLSCTQLRLTFLSFQNVPHLTNAFVQYLVRYRWMPCYLYRCNEVHVMWDNWIIVYSALQLDVICNFCSWMLWIMWNDGVLVHDVHSDWCLSTHWHQLPSCHGPAHHSTKPYTLAITQNPSTQTHTHTGIPPPPHLRSSSLKKSLTSPPFPSFTPL